MKVSNIYSIDVEDWFHILELESTPSIKKWERLESRVEKNLYTLLDDCEDKNVKATCFFLGWIAEKFPQLVKETARRGHEIACHGYAHQLIYTQSREEFRSDIIKSKDILEEITGKAVLGYRAPGFSIVNETPWALEELAACGFAYDSSIFPTSRGHGGLDKSRIEPHVLETKNGCIIEFPISIQSVFGKRMCFFGGGYLRLYPQHLIVRMIEKVNQSGRPVIVYVHPREIDPDHPRLQMGIKRRFKSYVNLKTTRGKLNKIFDKFNFTSFQDWILQNKNTGSYYHE